MKKIRLNEKDLRKIIRQTINESLSEGKKMEAVKKGIKGFGKKLKNGYNKFNNSIDDLTKEYDKDGNPIIDNPMNQDYNQYENKTRHLKLTESRLREIIHEAVKSALIEDKNIRTQ